MRLHYGEKNCKIGTWLILAHPRSDYSDKVGVFGRREIIYGNTVKLVKSAKLVLLHASTSISYAVLYKKPVIFMSCSAYLKIRIYYMSFRMAKILKTGAIVDICNSGTYEVAHDLFSIDNDAYEEYKRNFIKSNGMPEKKIWDVFTELIADG